MFMCIDCLANAVFRHQLGVTKLFAKFYIMVDIVSEQNDQLGYR